jgi:L-phenylalanine/L-methionine N-acetyltransferase
MMRLRSLTPADLERVWALLLQDPAANFDDDGPRSYEEFESWMLQRVQVEEIAVCELGEALAGVMAYRAVSERLAALHGICFDRSLHGRGIAGEAFQRFLASIWAKGFRKVAITHFADNARVAAFLARQGAVEEGLLRAHASRGGQEIDVRIAALFAPKGGDPCLSAAC